MSNFPSLMVIGTDTGVGKTVITALLVKKYLENNIKAAPFKPVVSGSVINDGYKIWNDISFLASATQSEDKDISLYKFEKPLSPHLAARAENQTIELSNIIERFKNIQEKNDAVIVEGAGGSLVPLNDKETLLDLAAELELPVVIVSRPDIGTINHTALTVSACRNKGIKVSGIVINRFPEEPDEACAANPDEIEKLTGVPVIGLVPEIDLSVEDVKHNGLEKYTGTISMDKFNSVILNDREESMKSNYQNSIEADKQFVWHPFTPMQEYLSEEPNPLMIVKAEGSYLEDEQGRKYIDGVSSLWVNIHGHRKKELDEAIKLQLDKVAHSTLLGLSNEPSALLAKELVDITPASLSKVFYSDNGSTAVEIGIKVAYQYWQQKGFTQKKEFISFVNAYHGDTIGSVSVGGMDIFHSKFKHLLFKVRFSDAAYCYRCPAKQSADCKLGCLDKLEEMLEKDSDKIAAVIMEPEVQGAAGILTQPPGYLKKVSDLCKEYSVLLIADEVATGFGRTGEMFACDLEGIEPDIMALAKGITGGYLPLAATLFSYEIYNAFLGPYEDLKTFFHGHTYTGNPLACAVALANLELLNQDGFMDEVRRKSSLFEKLLEPLNGHKHVGEIRLCGMMAGIELVKDKESRDGFPVNERTGRKVILKAREHGVIIRPLGDVVVLMPPLSISDDDLKKLVEKTALAIYEVTENGNG